MWREGKRSLLFIYVGGYGTSRDKMAQLVLNTTQKPLFNIEEACYRVCNSTNEGSAILSIFDLIEVDLHSKKQLFEAMKKEKMDENMDQILGKDQSGMLFCGIKRDQEVCKDKRVKLMLEILELMQVTAVDDRILSVPHFGEELVAGKMMPAIGAIPYNIIWVSVT